MSTEQSTGSLLNDAMARVSGLVRGEVDLARAEVSENMSGAAVALGMILGAAVIALTALNVLAAALVTALTELGIPAEWSAVIVGVTFAGIAYGMLQKGKSDLKNVSIAPTRTATNVKRDAQIAKENLHG